MEGPIIYFTTEDGQCVPAREINAQRSEMGELRFDPPLEAGAHFLLAVDEDGVPGVPILHLYRVLPLSDAPMLSRGITGREPMIGGQNEK
jgi:hypothetical protein